MHLLRLWSEAKRVEQEAFFLTRFQRFLVMWVMQIGGIGMIWVKREGENVVEAFINKNDEFSNEWQHDVMKDYLEDVFTKSSSDHEHEG